MKKAIVGTLTVIVLVLLILVCGSYGYSHFQQTHFFVEGVPYPKNATRLDLRGKDITTAHRDAILQQLPSCEILWDVAFQGGRYPSNSQTLSVTSLSESDIPRLMENFPDLTTLNAEGCRDYAVLEAFRAAKPSCQVLYSVDLGGKAVPWDSTTLALENGEYTQEGLLENLVHLPGLMGVHLRLSQLSPEELDAVRAAYPQLSISSTVEVLGQEYDAATTTQLDFSDLSHEEVAIAAGQICNLPNLNYVELSRNGISTLSVEDVRLLTKAAPRTAFNYTFTCFGQTLSSSQEEVIFKDQPIGDIGEQELRLALDLMPLCKRFVLDNCGFSNEVLAAVREDYRDQTKVVWRVWFGRGGSTLTDVTVLRAIDGLVDSNCHDMIYCEDTVFMDVGHNEQLYTAEFVAGMPNLQYCIFSGSPISDLTPFENCVSLKMLELTFCGYVKDITPLAACKNLEKLNISYTKVASLEPLAGLPMTNLNCMATQVSAKRQIQYKSDNPDTWAVFGGENGQPYGRGWRYDTTLRNYLPWYQLMRDVFFYDLELKAPNYQGWYATQDQMDRR